MFTNDIETHLNKNRFHLQYYSDNDEDCSCCSCECSNSNDENIIENNNTMSFNPDQSINMSTMTLINKSYHRTSDISHINNSLNYFDKHSHFSINHNHPSANSLKESSTPSQIKQSIIISNELASTKRTNEQQSADFQLIKNPKTDKQESSTIDLEYIYTIIDQSYTKLPIFSHSIKHTKLDAEFILSVNDYLDRLKANIYKDLIRRETLLRNGKTHTQNLISLIRCICKISYEQSLETSNDLNTSKHAILYTMTAIDYLLQRNFPQKKSLFNYILNEYIAMWLHENLRIIQEDFCIIVEHGTMKNYFPLCICFFHKLESLCAINWERLQMIQNYRLTHFDQLMKPTSNKLETNKDFILLFGKSLKSTMKRSEIPGTLLYSNRTDNELINIQEIHHRFKKSIAQILIQEHQKLPVSHSREIITPSVSTNVDLNLKNKEKSQSLISGDDQLMREKSELDGNEAVLTTLDQQEKSTWNIISETHTQPIEPVLLPPDPSPNQFLITLPSDILNEQERSTPAESKLLVSSEHQQLLWPMEMNSKQNTSLTSVHQSSSQDHSSLSQSQTSIKTRNDATFLATNTEQINRSDEPISKPINLFSELSEHQNDTQKTQNRENSPFNSLSVDHSLREPTTSVFNSPEKPLTSNRLSSPSYQIDSDKNTTIDSKAILNTEVNALIQFLTDLANSSSLIQQENEPSSLLKQLESCLKQNNIDSNSISQTIRHTHPQSSLDVTDPVFLTAFTRALRKELEDAQILRQIEYGQSNEDSQNIGYLSFETRNILKLPKIDTSFRNKDTAAGDNIDHDRVFIEVTHDPSRCTRNSELSHLCASQHQRFNKDGSPKSMDTVLSSTEFPNQQSSSLDTNHLQQRSYWIHSNKSSLCKDCIITPNSLFCARKSLDKNTHSVTVEHNEGLR